MALGGFVTLEADGLPTFPMLPSVPGVYCFDLGRDDLGMRTLYIGKSAVTETARIQLSQRQI